MSDLLNQASLVMVPSGYKEDTVYSVVPSDGSGDLSFTRASNGTRVNSAGLVEVVAWNLAQYSEQFNNAIYTVKNAVTIVDNSTTAPNGTSTADLIYPNSSGTFRYVAQIFSQSTNIYTTSIYAKAQNKSVIWMYMDDSDTNGIVYFDLSDGTMSVTAGSSSTPIGTMTAVGNGWYRCTFTTGANTSLSSGSGFGVCDAKGSAYATASGTNGVYLWGYQANIGATAKPYFPTTDRLNVPRLTYQNGGGGCPSLLLEPQSTNLITYSEQFDNADWNKQNISVTANATTSPDGTQNADKLIANTSNARHLIFQAFNVSTTHTFTTYAKAGENSFLIMRLDTDSPEVKTWFNLSNGTIGTSQGGSPTITSVGNGWYRCSVQFATTTSQSIYPVMYTAKTDGSEVFVGNNSDGTFIWGAQLEAGNYPTSYIPTTSSSATRVIDDCRKTGISSLIGQSEGTLFIDLNLTAWDSNSFYFGLYGGGNEIYFRCTATGAIGFVHYFGSTQAFLSQSGLSLGRHKLAACYKNNDWAFYVDGILAGTDTSGTFSGTISEMVFGYTSISAYPPFHSVNQAILFPTRLTNAELQALTTL